MKDLGAIHGKQFGQFSMIISAAVSSLGAALLPLYLVEGELRDKWLIALSNLQLKTRNAYYIVKPLGSTSPQVDAFTRWLQTSTRISGVA